MQFSAFTRTVTGDTILFKNINPLENVQLIKSYSDNSIGFTKKEIRWSFNGTYWSAWQTLTQSGISKIANSNPYLFLEIRYVGTGTVTTLSINYIGDAYIIPATTPTITPTPTVETPVSNTSSTGIHSFSSFTRTTSGNTVLFKNSTPIENVKNIRTYSDNFSGPTGTKKEIRWSFNNTYWSSWQPLTQSSISKIVTSSNQYLFLEIRYAVGPVTNLSINYVGAIYVPSIDAYVSNYTDTSVHVTVDEIKRYVVTKITNAETLNNYPGSWYLNRLYHTGKQNIDTIIGLQTILRDLTGAAGITYSYLDGSLALRDASILWLFNNKSNITHDHDGRYLKESSIGSGFYWINGMLDASVASGTGDVTKTYVDGSIANFATNASVNIAISKSFASNASLGNISEIIIIHEASIDSLTFRQSNTESALNNKQQIGDYIVSTSTGIGLFWNNGLLDVSITSSSSIFTGDISTSHVYYESFLDPALVMPSAVGGIPAGTTVNDLRGDSVTTILNDLLFPTIQPTLTAPSATLTMSPTTTLYEVSANIASLQFTTAFNKGTIYNGAVYQNVRSGSCNNYNYTGTNLVDASSSSSTNVQSFAYNVALGNQSWSCQVSYNQGPQPLDNKGNNAVTGPLVAGTLTASSTQTITGAYPLYATTSDITTLTKQTLVLMTANPAPSTSGMLLVAESGGNKQKFEIPVLWPSTDLTGIETYNTVSSQWEYELGSAVLSLSRWTISDTTETIQGYINQYKRYTYNGPDRNSVTIRLVI